MAIKLTGGIQMSNKNAAIELLERELEECECRAKELRDAIAILAMASDTPRERWERVIQSEDSSFTQHTTKYIAAKILRQYPKGLSTQGLWNAIEKEGGGGVSHPKSLNAILNRHDDVFTRHPADSRHWILKRFAPEESEQKKE